MHVGCGGASVEGDEVGHSNKDDEPVPLTKVASPLPQQEAEGTAVMRLPTTLPFPKRIELTANGEQIDLGGGHLLRLAGIIRSSTGDAIALLDQNGQSMTVREGDHVAQFRIQTIGLRSVVLHFSLGESLRPAVTVATIQSNSHFNISLSDVPFRDAIRAIAEPAQINVILPEENGELSTKRVTMRLAGVSPQQALRQLVRAHGLVIHEGDNAWIITRAGSDSPKDKLNEQQLLSTLQQSAPQVLLECQVIETTESALRELGIQWGSPAGKASIGYRAAERRVLPADFTTTLTALVSKGVAKVLARPRVMAISGEEAVIKIGNRIPFAVPVTSSGASTQWRVEYLDAGISLRITPNVLADRSITAALHPEVSQIAEWRATAAGEFPVMSTRQADATVHVKDGETIQIGGLLSETERENFSKIPILGDLPILGLPFQNRTIEKVQTEVIFLITPKLL